MPAMRVRLITGALTQAQLDMRARELRDVAESWGWDLTVTMAATYPGPEPIWVSDDANLGVDSCINIRTNAAKLRITVVPYHGFASWVRQFQVPQPVEELTPEESYTITPNDTYGVF